MDDIKCPDCLRGNEPKWLDGDGVQTKVSGDIGLLRHAYDDAWWPCVDLPVKYLTLGERQIIRQVQAMINERIDGLPQDQQALRMDLNNRLMAFLNVYTDHWTR